MKEQFKSVSDKKIRTFFYRDNFYKLFKWLFICFFILVICLIWAIYVYYTKPKRKYYVVTQYGIVREIMPKSGLL